MRKGALYLNITRGGGQSSVFEPNRELTDKLGGTDPVSRMDIVARRELVADKPDDVLRENGISDVDFIKLDTQGSELMILEGGRSVVGESVVGLEVEVELAAMYVEQPLFADVDRHAGVFSSAESERLSGHLVAAEKRFPRDGGYGDVLLGNAPWIEA